MAGLKLELLELKKRIMSLEERVENQSKVLGNRIEVWSTLENKINDNKLNNQDIININVGGTLFTTTKLTLTKIPGTLFCDILNSENFNPEEEIFFDRSPKYFPLILDFLRFNKLNYRRFKDIVDTKIFNLEKDYYKIPSIRKYLRERDLNDYYETESAPEDLSGLFGDY